MRIAVLWLPLAGYLNACYRALANTPDARLFVSYQSSVSEAPYSDGQFDWIRDSYRYESVPDENELPVKVRAFDPELLIVASWHLAAYRKVCHEFRGRAIRVCCMDNQWRNRPKQWLGIATSRMFVQRMFDAAFVAGERQALFARKLGFSQEQIWRGFLSCDHAAFHGEGSKTRIDQREKAFLYVGRLAEVKAVDVLMAAYRRYRAESNDPWPLWIAGTGPLADKLGSEPGVVYHGFVQPGALPELFAKASCFVLPSRFEPWGVVIHEATAAGLPVICTERCGAAVHLVQDGYNGFITSADAPEALARAMSRISMLPPDRLKAMSEASVSLSWQFTPERWADYVRGRTEEAIAEGTLFRRAPGTADVSNHVEATAAMRLPSPAETAD